MDRTNRVRLLAIGTTFFSLMTVLSGFTKTYATLFAARVGVGLGEATVTPASSSLISDYFPPEKRSKAFGVLLVGGAVGSGAAYLFGGFAIVIAEPVRQLFPSLLGSLEDWHITFIVIGVPGFILAPLLLLTIKEPVRREIRKETTSSKASLSLAWRHFRRHTWAYLGLYLGAMLSVAMVYAQLGWLPAAFIRLYGWTPPEIATALSLVSVPCAVVSSLGAGWLMGWFFKRGRLDGPIIVAGTQAVVWAVFGGIKFQMPSGELALVIHVFTTLSGTLAMTAALTGIAQITPNEIRGQFTGVFTMLTGIVSVSAGALIVGFLSDNVFTGDRGIANSLSTVFIGLGSLAALMLVLGWRSFKRASDDAREWAETSSTQ